MEPDFDIVRNVKAKADIWKHFGVKKRKIDGSIEQNLAVCRKCEAVVKCGGGGTSNMTTHLRRHHPGLLSDSEQLAVKAGDNAVGVSGMSGQEESPKNTVPRANSQLKLSSMFMMQNKYKSTSPRAVDITQKIAKFIIKDLRPYSVVESTDFRDLLSTLDPRYQPPSRKQLTEVIVPRLYNDVKAVVCEKLQKMEQVSLTSDGWTSRNMESFVTITATGIDNNWEMMNYILQTRPLPENHTAEHIASVIRASSEEWKLPFGLGLAFVSDNASNMVKTGKLLNCYVHIGCFAHTLNLAVQKALKVKRVSHIIARIRRIVSFFHRSAVATALLKSKSGLLMLPNHKLKIDVCTRWNSAYDMITRFLEMQMAVVAVLRSKEISSVKEKDLGVLSDDDIYTAEDIITCLKSIKDITTMLCTESLPTASIIMPIHYRLVNSILASDEKDSATIGEMKSVMLVDLKDRYINTSQILNVISALDPRFKSLPYLSDDEKFLVFSKITSEAAGNIVTDDCSGPSNVTNPSLPTTMSTSIDSNCPTLPILPDFEGSSITTASPVFESTKSVKVSASASVLSNLLGDMYAITNANESTKSPHEHVQAELDKYKGEVPIPLNDDPLLWWRDHQYKYPLLAKLAKCLLCIPATSVPSERVFSTAGDIVTASRATLTGKHVDMLLFLKKNM